MRNWLRHGLLIGHTEFRRSVRGIREDRTQLAMIGGGTLVMALGSALMAAVIVFFGDALVGQALPPAAGGAVAITWGFLVYMYAARGVSQEDRIDAEPMLLTTTSPRAVATGIVSAEVLRGLAYLGLPAVILTFAAAYATGAPLLVVVALPTLAALLATGALVGYAIGIGIALLIATSPFVAKYKTYLGGGLVVVLMPVLFYAFSGRLDYALLSWLPLAWYADLLALAAPVEVSTTRAVGAVGLTAVVAVLGGLAVDRLTAAYWYTDAVEVEDDGPRRTSAPAESALEAALGRVPLPLGPIGRPARTVAIRAFLQTRRNPSKLWFQLIVVFAMAPSLITGAGGGVSLRAVAPGATVVLPWLAGSLFALNALGDEGDVLPATLTATVSGREYARGFLALAALVGVPLIVPVVLGAGLLGPYALPEVAGLLVLALAALAASAPLALALGVRFPRFTAVSGGWGDREVVPPSLTATGVHVLTIFVLGGMGALSLLAPAFARLVAVGLLWLVAVLPAAVLAGRGVGPAAAVVEWGEGLVEALDAVAAASVRIAGYGGALVAFLAIGVLSYRYAVGRFDRYTVD